MNLNILNININGAQFQLQPRLQLMKKVIPTGYQPEKYVQLQKNKVIIKSLKLELILITNLKNTMYEDIHIMKVYCIHYDYVT